MNIFRIITELVSDTNYSARESLDQEFDGYGYMKRVYGIEHMPDTATITKVSITDTLTKAYNRFAFEPFFEEEIHKAKRYKHSLSLVILGINYFRSINHDYGSVVGDFILIELADLVRDKIRTSDMLFRWNGDEFLIITPHTDKEGINIMIKNLKEDIDKFHFNNVGNISCSFAHVEYNYSDAPAVLIKKLEDELHNIKLRRI